MLEKEAAAQMKWLKKRNEYTHKNLLKDVRLSEPSDFQNFLRLDGTSLDELLKMITPRIEPFIRFSPFLKLECKELNFFNRCLSASGNICLIRAIVVMRIFLGN